MKYLNFEECIDVLKKAGGILKLKYSDQLIHLKDGNQCDYKTGEKTKFNFSNNAWIEYKDWREELNGKKTLCYAWDSEEQYKRVACVKGYVKEDQYPVKTESPVYCNCKRMTKAEIAEYMKNAPEVEDVD